MYESENMSRLITPMQVNIGPPMVGHRNRPRNFCSEGDFSE